MKSMTKLIRRFVGILLLSGVLLVVLNFILFVIIMVNLSNGTGPYTTAEKTAAALQIDESGHRLSDEMTIELKKADAWAIYIDNETMEVVWHTENLPDTIPASYTISDIASLTRGYLDGYPTYTGESEGGLVVVGFPKEQFWKHISPSWDYSLIKNLPVIILAIIVVNVIMILIIYIAANSKLLKSLKPITNGIQALPAGSPVYVREKGLLSDLALKINQTSEILQAQKQDLRKKETAQANWIAGVSHDIRTPLSMVMGYAGQLKEDKHLTDEERQKAIVIVKHSERMRNLINDLNLASKLEYNMQPINPSKENLVAIIRQVVVNFININIDDKHSIIWETDEALTSCPVNVDKDLIKRAISNLIQNSISHNEQGCKIYIHVAAEEQMCSVVVGDDGAGVSDEQIERLNNAPHYMVCDENIREQSHGLGLLIVKQIIAVHGGSTKIYHSKYGGFEVAVVIPLQS